MRLITCKNGHRYDPDLTPECPECLLMDCGGFDFDIDFPELTGDFLPENVAAPEEKGQKLRTCEKGHQYDASLTKECPICALEEEDAAPAEESPKLIPEQPGALWVACKNGHRYDPALTPECPECALLADIMEEFSFDGNAVDPESVPQPKATGWLVGIRGPAWGRSFELCEECSYIGSGPLNEVSIPQDTTLSAEKHCVIAYDDVDRRFYVGMSQGQSMIRLNGSPVLATRELKQGDRLEIGQGTYLFVPLCGEGFAWADHPRFS